MYLPFRSEMVIRKLVTFAKSQFYNCNYNANDKWNGQFKK